MSAAEQEARRLLELAYAAQMAGDLAEAIELYQRSIRLHPTAEAHTFLGWTYSFLGRHEEAIAECQRAIVIDPSFGNPYNDIGAYLIDLGRPQEAIPWLQRAIRAERYEPRHFPHINLARAYEQLGQLDAALQELQTALKIEPGHAEARRMLRRIVARLN